MQILKGDRMKASKTICIALYLLLILLLTFHFSMVVSIFYSDSPLFFGNIVSFSATLKGQNLVLFSVALVLSLGFAFFNARLLYFLQRKSLEPINKSIISLTLLNALVLLLALAPLFFRSYKESYLYRLSEDANTYIVVIFIILLSFICFFLFYYLKKVHDRHTLDFQHMLSQIQANDLELENEINEDKKLLIKWQNEIKAYSTELEAVETVPSEIVEYYKSIENSFHVLENEVGGDKP